MVVAGRAAIEPHTIERDLEFSQTHGALGGDDVIFISSQAIWRCVEKKTHRKPIDNWRQQSHEMSF